MQGLQKETTRLADEVTRAADYTKRAGEAAELVALKMDANNQELKTLNTTLRLVVVMLEGLAKKNNSINLIQESK